MTADITNAPDAALTIQEQSELEHHEEVIRQGLQSFLAVGEALMDINTRRLYRAGYATFQDYCRDRWGIGRERAYQLMGAAEVVANLSTIVDTTPANESQARPLTALPAADQPGAWQEALQTAPGGKVTGAHVQQVVDRKLGKESKSAPATPARPSPPPTVAPAAPAAPTPISPVVLTPLPATPIPAPVATVAAVDPRLLQAAILARLLQAAAARAGRAWEALHAELMERGQFATLAITDEQLVLAAQQLLDAPATRMAASFLGMGASLTLEQLDGSPIELAEEVIA